MARRQVTFEEVRGAGSVADRIEVRLGPPPPPAWRGRAGLEDRRPRRWPALVALAALLAGVVAWSWSSATPAAEEGAEQADETAPSRTSLRSSGLVVVRASDVVEPPWGGVFEHHPDVRGPVSVPQVHVLSLAGDDGASALLVVDATRRAFSAPERGWSAGDRLERVLGTAEGDGIRTLQWDDAGYGISLTAVGLTAAEQRRLAGAVLLPDGPALVHGRAPRLDDVALGELGLDLTDLRSGPGTAIGSHLIGQSGGASIDGLVHRSDGGVVLISIVEDQVVSASRVRRALSPHADVPVVPGAGTAALVSHDGPAGADRRVRGWYRLLIDHPAGVTFELSTDVLGPDDLLALAATLDLDSLARTVAPR